jgi:hypothetical protein
VTIARLKAPGLAASLCATALLLFGCGDSKDRELLSQRSATRLEASLDRVSQLVRDGDCTSAASQAGALRAQVGALPPRTSSKLRDALATSAERLRSLVSQGCKPAQPTAAPEPTVTTPPVTEQAPEDKKGKGPKKIKQKDQQPEQAPQDGNQGNGNSGGNGLGNQTVPNDQTNSGGSTP